MTDRSDIRTDDEPINGFFGLTYSSYLVLPRVLLQSMPTEWQQQFVPLLEDMYEAFAHVEQPDCYDVRAAVEKEAEELTDAERELTGVTFDEGEGDEPDRWHDRDGNELRYDSRVLVPVADPLPAYNRGRTRVPRADQLGSERGLTVGEAIIALVPGAEGAGVKP